MSIQTVLESLDGIRSRGMGQWSARCPCHDDQSPSLSIRETDDGAVLLHCFAGCGIDDVLGSLGMEFADLYPERTGRMSHDVKRPRLSGWAVVDAICFRLTCITLLANKLRKGEALSDGDQRMLNESIVAMQCAIAEARHVR